MFNKAYLLRYIQYSYKSQVVYRNQTLLNQTQTESLILNCNCKASFNLCEHFSLFPLNIILNRNYELLGVVKHSALNYNCVTKMQSTNVIQYNNVDFFLIQKTKRMQQICLCLQILCHQILYYNAFKLSFYVLQSVSYTHLQELPKAIFRSECYSMLRRNRYLM